MKIKKIITGKDKNAGDIVELTAEEKVAPTLQDAIIEHPFFKGITHVWLRDVSVESVNFSPRGDLFNKKWQNNSYTSSGVCTIHRRDLATDSLRQPLRYRFDIVFHDKLDSLGQPDTKTDKLDLERV